MHGTGLSRSPHGFRMFEASSNRCADPIDPSGSSQEHIAPTVKRLLDNSATSAVR